MIHGLGIDLIEVARLERAIAAHGVRFLDRVFTAVELRHAEQLEGRARTIHLAGRFAAKEAGMKALGTGVGSGIGFRDLEVRAPLGGGAPALAMLGAAEQRSAKLGTSSVLLSITHTDSHAVAVVILEGPDR